jgi:hypothetical protein
MTKVRTPLATAQLVKRLVVAVAAGAVGVGVFAAPAAAEPQAQSCQAEVISTSVQPWELGPGRRAVADTFFGDSGAKAVQVAERTLQEFCASQ